MFGLFSMVSFIISAHAQNIESQVETLNTLPIGNGGEISTNKITFTVKNNEGIPLNGQQVLLPVIIDDQSGAFTIATPPTNVEGVTSLVFQNVTRGDSKIVFADLTSLTLQQAVQPLGCCQIEYVGNIDQPIPIIEQYGPIAICAQSINSCTGQMLQSGAKSTFNTGAWTNLSQPCTRVNSATIEPLLCGSGNPGPGPVMFGVKYRNN